MSNTYAQAVQCHKAGDLQRAEQLYRDAVKENPQQAGALHMLGVLAQQAGEHQQSLDWINQAIVIDRDQVGYHFSRGLSQAGLEQWKEAVDSFQIVLKKRPDFAPAHRQLGDVLFAQEQHEAAAQSYRRAIQLAPDDPATLLNYSITLDRLGSPVEALTTCRQAIEQRADWPTAHHHLGNLLLSQNQFVDAESAYRKVIEWNPRDAVARNNLGNALREQERLEEALVEYRSATQCDATLAEPLGNMGNLYLARGEMELAAQCFRQALELEPQDVVTQSNLGGVLRELGQLDAAIEACRCALAIDPNYAVAHNNLGNCLISQSRLSEAAEAFRQALAQDPSDAKAHSNLLAAMLLDTDYSPEEIFSQHVCWGKQHGSPANPLPPSTNDRSPDRTLRIGYVSPDFRHHAVAKFFQPILENHASEAFETYCYAELIEADEVTEKLRQRADHWRNTCGTDDREMAQMIRDDQIDILVDLAGHTLGNRLQALAYRPAPVQVTYLGYPATTGLRAIDYRLTDSLADPPECDRWHTESLVRLEQSFLCFSSLQDAPDVAPSPASHLGYITFGSFNKLGKFNEATASRWAEILRQVPQSRLLMKTKPLGDTVTRQRILEMFEQQNIEPGRILLEGHSPTARKHLETYAKIDIALDAFPYHGTTTTCDALWMGVPVVTLAGQTHVSRVGVSLLSTLGHSELIANSEDQYVSIAVELANDLPRLKELRTSLRPQMQESPLCDAVDFTKGLEQAYRNMWSNWCQSQSK